MAGKLLIEKEFYKQVNHYYSCLQ